MKSLKKLATFEFVALMAMLMSLTALAIDAILPALQIIRTEYLVQNPNEAQHLISSVFAGLVFGQLIYGPLSDSFGRKKLIHIGISIFIIGCFVSLYAGDYSVMLLGRFLQGIGVASTRVLTMAMVRDEYSGNAMGRIMSLITMVFIIVPAFAPSIGQFIMLFGHWHYIIWFFIFIAIIGMLWLQIRQPETLAIESRKPATFKRVKEAAIIILSNRTTMGYATTSGIIFGAFIGYLLSSQQIFTQIFNQQENFPIYFGLLAASIGFSSFVNSRFVEKYGMRRMCFFALKALCLITLLFLACVHYFEGQPSLGVFMLFMLAIFMCVGVLFGNFNSLAIEPVGHVAGVATAIITSLQNIISLSLGSLIGSAFNMTIYPMAIGFFILSLLASFIMLWTEKFQMNFPRPAETL